MKRTLLGFTLFVVGQSAFINPSQAYVPASLPQCVGDHNETLPIDTAQVLEWKQSTPNQFLARAHVSGTIAKVYPNKNGHAHFSVKIGPNPKDTIEMIYNLGFGELPKLKVGMTVEGCGDYITSTAVSGQYQPSPDGAILHWIHKSNNTSNHENGFIAIDGALYGFFGDGGGSDKSDSGSADVNEFELINVD